MVLGGIRQGNQAIEKNSGLHRGALLCFQRPAAFLLRPCRTTQLFSSRFSGNEKNQENPGPTGHPGYIRDKLLFTRFQPTVSPQDKHKSQEMFRTGCSQRPQKRLRASSFSCSRLISSSISPCGFLDCLVEDGKVAFRIKQVPPLREIRPRQGCRPSLASFSISPRQTSTISSADGLPDSKPFPLELMALKASRTVEKEHQILPQGFLDKKEEWREPKDWPRKIYVVFRIGVM